MITHNKDATVVVKTFTEPMEALFFQKKLKEEGVESFLVDENVVGLNPMGEIELKIFSSDLEKAEQIISVTKYS